MAGNMTLTIREIAAALEAKAFGNLDLELSGISDPSEAGPDDLALAMSSSFVDKLHDGRAEAALIGKEVDWTSLPLKAAIQVDTARLTLAQVTELFIVQDTPDPLIHPLACVANESTLGAGCSVGPYSVIDKNCVIGTDCRIGANCTIGEGVRIGNQAVIHPGVRIARGITIGDRLIVQSNTVIGSDGFSFVSEGENRVEVVRSTLRSDVLETSGRQIRIHSHGTVVIGDDVEIGANCAIDRGTISATVIGDGTKLDNQVHVAHNVRIGKNCLICGQVGIAGSAVIGDRVALGGKSGVSDHIRIGDDVVAAGASNIYTRIPTGKAVMGSPAIDLEKNIDLYKNLRRLPRLFKRIREIESRLRKGQGDA